MTNDIITISGLDAAVSSTADARNLRDGLLAKATLFTTVKSNADALVTAEMLKEIKGFTRRIEDARKSVKLPVLEIGKRIDGLAAELTEQLDAESVRISRTLGAWQAEQQRIADEARRKAWEEEQKIKDEANRLIAAAQESSKTEAAFEKKAERIEGKAVAAIVGVRVEAARYEAAKPSGIATREDVLFEVTDIVALHGAAPYLVNMTPNNAAIRSALKGLQAGQSLPGVRHWKEAKSFVR